MDGAPSRLLAPPVRPSPGADSYGRELHAARRVAGAADRPAADRRAGGRDRTGAARGRVRVLRGAAAATRAARRRRSGSELEKVRGCCSVIAITRGEQGSIVFSEDQRWDIGIFSLGDLVDTTGAGDLFAGGVLHAYTQGESLQSCGELDALCAGQIVTQLGARSQVDLKELAKTHRS